MSIELQKEEENSQPEYMIEIYLQKINIYILPKVRNHISLRKPSSVFMSRKSTVLDLRIHMAEILAENSD